MKAAAANGFHKMTEAQYDGVRRMYTGLKSIAARPSFRELKREWGMAWDQGILQQYNEALALAKHALKGVREPK